MNDLMIINDTHLGVSRSAGATRESNANLQNWQFQQFRRLFQIAQKHQYDVLINGDLFDKFDVGGASECFALSVLMAFLRDNPRCHLYIALGNHDISRDSSKQSSFDTLAHVLHMMPEHHTKQLTVIDSAPYFADDFAIVPHCPNQTLFDEALNAVLQHQPKPQYCFVHANLMNGFAAQADHSLNIDDVMLNRFRNENIELVFGHEHHGRQATGATVIGNQIPTSVADCLDPNPCKQYAVLHRDSGSLKLYDFLTLSDVYEEVDWQTESLPDKLFIRITGEARYEQAVEVVNTLASWRKTHSAFVLTNAVKIGTHDKQLTAQDVQSETFDIWQEILSQIPDSLQDFAKQVMGHYHD